MYKNMCRYTKNIFIRIINTFIMYFCTINWITNCFPVCFYVYTRSYIFTGLLHLFPLIKLAGPPYNFRVPDLHDRKKKVPLHSYGGSGFAGARNRRNENLCPFSHERISMVGTCAACQGKGVSRGAACRSRAYFSSVANTVSERQTQRDSRLRCPPLTGLLSCVIFNSGATCDADPT